MQVKSNVNHMDKKSFKNLIVYKNSYKLSIIIHKISLKLPFEVRDIADQIRRCSRSIPTNIIEGYARNKSIKDRINFLRTALGSNDEMLVHLRYLIDLNLYEKKIVEKIMESYELNGKRLNKLITFNKNLTRSLENEQTR